MSGEEGQHTRLCSLGQNSPVGRQFRFSGRYIYKMLAYQHVKITTEIKNRHSTFVKSNITVEPPIRDPPRFPAKDT